MERTVHSVMVVVLNVHIQISRPDIKQEGVTFKLFCTRNSFCIIHVAITQISYKCAFHHKCPCRCIIMSLPVNIDICGYHGAQSHLGKCTKVSSYTNVMSNALYSKHPCL